MIKHIRALVFSLVLIIAPLSTLLTPAVAHAQGGGTFVWVGGSGEDWDTPANWQGGNAPQTGDTGDTIVINNAVASASGSIDNIAGPLSITNLEFENDSSGSAVSIELDDPLTITGSITLKHQRDLQL